MPPKVSAGPATAAPVVFSVPPIWSVPPLTVTVPLRMFVPLRIAVPESSLVKLPVPRATAPLMVMFPAPPTLRFWLSAITELALLRVSVPASAAMRAVPARVIVPPKVFVPLMLRSAPS